MTDDQAPAKNERLITAMVVFGWFCLISSTIAVTFLTAEIGNSESSDYSTYLIIARIFGMVSFVVGVVAMMHERWLSASLLLVGSIILPIVSLFVAGSI